MKIIVNADDFGISSHVNNAIYQTMIEKHISSTTIMAVGDYVDEAIEMTKEFNDISFGVHLVYDGPFTFLTEESKGIGYNNNNIINIKGLNFSKVDLIYNEFCAQIEKVKNLGVSVSHIDTHHHLHLYPIVLAAAIKAANTYNITKIRTQKLLVGSLPNKIYRTLHHKVTDIFNIHQPSYYTDFPTLLKSEILKDDTVNGVIEVMCHPGSKYNDEQYFNDNVYASIKNKMINYHQFNN